MQRCYITNGALYNIHGFAVVLSDKIQMALEFQPIPAVWFIAFSKGYDKLGAATYRRQVPMHSPGLLGTLQHDLWQRLRSYPVELAHEDEELHAGKGKGRRISGVHEIHHSMCFRQQRQCVYPFVQHARAVNERKITDFPPVLALHAVIIRIGTALNFDFGTAG